jgi:hypothetical protein
MLDRRAEPALGVRSLAEQGAGTRLDAARPIGARGVCLCGQPLQCVRREIGHSASGMEAFAERAGSELLATGEPHPPVLNTSPTPIS